MGQQPGRIWVGVAVAAAALVGLAAMAPRETAPPGAGAPASTPRASSAPAASAEVVRGATTLRARGVIEGYDTVTRLLTLATASGPVRFPLSGQTRIRQGTAVVTDSRLEQCIRSTAIVRYSETDGARTVESVHVIQKRDDKR